MTQSLMPQARNWFGRAVRTPFVAGALLLAVAMAPARVHGAPETPDKGEIDQKWVEGLAALGSGRFDEAFNLIHDVAKTRASDDRIAHVEKWIESFETLQRARAARTLSDYEQYVAWAREDMSKAKDAAARAKAEADLPAAAPDKPAVKPGDGAAETDAPESPAESSRKHWQAAIGSASKAFNTAPSEEAFRNESWLKELIEGSLTAAGEYEDTGKWVSAARIYVRLADIFPHNKNYKESLERCQAHLRLDYTYSAESDWTAAVSSITPGMARDAFRQIETEYIVEPNFKDAAVAALKHLLLMTREKKIGSVFTRLGAEEVVEEFRDRVGTRLKVVQDDDSLNAQDLINEFERVLQINDETELFPQTVLVHEFVHGALRPLDPFSDMLWPSDIAEFNKHTQGKFYGVGISIHKEPGEPLKVVSPLEDSPAYNAGIQAGDLITGINGEPSKKLTITKAVRTITGPAGTTVTLTIKRPGVEKEFDVTLERQEITIFTIKGFERDEQGRWKFMIDPASKIGYVRMTNFTENTTEELREVITRLRKQEGMRGLIFDLRGNPGGPLKAAVDVSDMFLEGGKKIVATKDRRAKPWEAPSSTDPDGHFTDFPMIVIVNGASASASEIVSGALQVHGRALILGERSFGKGSVQQVLRLRNSNKAYLKLTTAKYYLPNGRCLHRDEDSTTWGVDPDVEVKLVPKEIVKVLELRVNNDVLRGKNQKDFTKEYVKSVTTIKPATRPADGKDGEEREDGEDEESAGDEDEELADIQRPDPNEYPELDPQLDAALMLMRVRITSEQPWPMKKAPEVAAAPKPADIGAAR